MLPVVEQPRLERATMPNFKNETKSYQLGYEWAVDHPEAGEADAKRVAQKVTHAEFDVDPEEFVTGAVNAMEDETCANAEAGFDRQMRAEYE